MKDYKNLVEALRWCMYGECKSCVYRDICVERFRTGDIALDRLHKDAADAIEALNRLLDQNTQRCEALREQLRKAHENYEKHLNELEAQMSSGVKMEETENEVHSGI